MIDPITAVATATSAFNLIKKGFQAVGLKETNRENFYVYGSIEPLNGSFLMQEHDKMSAQNFQEFLDAFGQTYHSEFHVMICDGSTIHWSKELNVPKNLAFVQLPPYCPELNPIERVWQDLKKHLSWKNWKSLSEMKTAVFKLIEALNFDSLYTLTAWDWILDAQLDN